MPGRSYPGRIEHAAKLSVSLPDDLVRDLGAVAHDNMSAFVTAAVRRELDRRRLQRGADEGEDDAGVDGVHGTIVPTALGCRNRPAG